MSMWRRPIFGHTGFSHSEFVSGDGTSFTSTTVAEPADKTKDPRRPAARWGILQLLATLLGRDPVSRGTPRRLRRKRGRRKNRAGLFVGIKPGTVMERSRHGVPLRYFLQGTYSARQWAQKTARERVRQAA